VVLAIVLVVVALLGGGWGVYRSTRYDRWKNPGRYEFWDFLGVEPGSPIDSFRSEKHVVSWQIDFERALRDGLAELGFEVEPKGMNGAKCAYGFEHNGLSILLGEHFTGPFGWVGSVVREVAPGRMESFDTECVYFCRGGRFPIALALGTVGYSADMLELYALVPGVEGAHEWAVGIVAGLERWVQENSVYRGSAMVPHFDWDAKLKRVDLVDPGTAKGIRLEAGLVRQLEEGFLAFVRHADVLASCDLASNRGLLLCGEPGTGKTSTVRYLRDRLPGYAFVIVDGDAARNVRALFDFARRLAPAVVVIEDIDLLVRTRDPQDSSPFLKDLLNEMDGLNRRERVSVVMTSNSWKFIESALADRPGRIDQIVRYDPPTPEHRLVLLKDLTAKLSLDGDIAALVPPTEDVTPATLTEIVKRGTIRSLLRAEAGGDATVRLADFLAALGELRSNRKTVRPEKRIGLKRIEA
jgi:hypothetical protein